jgi:hypothetical protein
MLRSSLWWMSKTRPDKGMQLTALRAAVDAEVVGHTDPEDSR